MDGINGALFLREKNLIYLLQSKQYVVDQSYILYPIVYDQILLWFIKHYAH